LAGDPAGVGELLRFLRMHPLHVATLNIRNLADRWDERLPLLLADMAALQPDLLGLQEVAYVLQQDRLIGAAGEGRYECTRGWAARPEYGNTLLVRQPLVATDTRRLDLGAKRSAIRATVMLPWGTTVLVATTHLHHLPHDVAVRDEQVSALLAWLAVDANTEVQIVVGDFNAKPDEPAYARMVAGGFGSAYATANGHEPALTLPSGLQAPAADTDGPTGCVDYIWVRGSVAVESCRLVFDRPAVADPTLYPSDHFGVSAHLTLG
jgi:endonuclease/exonuclease/phosphatase family metal-dependent hydrolase